MAKQNTPIWLDLKTEYIDANLNKVLDYLAKESKQPDSDAFYAQTEQLLKRRVEEIITELISMPIGAEDADVDKAEILQQLKILGAFILIQSDKSGTSIKEAYFFFVKLLLQVLSDSYTEDLADVAIKCLTKNTLQHTGFNWEDLFSENLEIIAHKIINASSFQGESTIAWYQGKGSLKLENGSLEIFETNKDDSSFKKFASSLCILDDVIKVQTAPSDRIIQSEAKDFSVMNSFTMAVMREQAKTNPSTDKSLKQYRPGEKVVVKYTGLDSSNNLMVETMEGDHEKIRGLVSVWSQVYMNFYSGADLVKYLPKGCFFEAVYKGGEKNTFDVADTFVKSMVDNTVRVGEEVNAVLKNVHPKTQQMMWWTQDGYPAYVAGKDNPGTYNIGDTAYIQITSCASNAFVYSEIIEPSTEPVDEEESRKYCIDGFPLEEEPVFSKPPVQNHIEEAFVLGLNRLLFLYQNCLDQASERYRVLCVCRILSTLTEDAESLQYVETACDFLRAIISFAKDEYDKIRSLSPTGELASNPVVKKWQSIIMILQSYGKEDAEDFLSGVIHDDTDADPFLIKLAKLVQSSNRIDDVYPAIKTVIKGQITKLLSVETANNANLEDAAGPNLGVENSRTEFKTSFFFAPENSYEQIQEKNIFRDLCSFLNTREGGTMYLGVNDNGGINGLQNDLEHLEQKINGNYTGLDGYVRYITDRAREYFDLDVRIHFKIEPAYDGRVVVIKVEPYEHGVVEFEGVPYIRNNNESVKMSQTLRRQIEAKQITSNSEKSDKIVALTEAIREERKVILHNYASSNSDDVRLRNVEPFAFLSGYAFVWCYDLDDNKNKLFRLSRIGDVEITRNNWTQKLKHQKGKTDIFHFSGDTPIPVKLQLDLMAKNLLLEEYPDAESELSPMGGNEWLLQTKVYQIVGIGRFYTGLANHITIIDAPELVEYAKTYFQESLKAL